MKPHILKLGGYTLKIKTIATIVAVLSMGLLVVGMVSATPSPNGPGQPKLECGGPGATNYPPGFLTPGFEHAGTVYAGSDGSASLEHANSEHAVSQYDVACFQVTQNKP